MVPTFFVALAGALLLILAFGWTLSWTATRLDRLHNRVEGARAALDAQLVRRASVALEVATAGLLDPASSVLLAEAAHEAREVGGADRAGAETALTQALAAALPADTMAELREDPAGEQLLRELAAACTRVQLARRFLNEGVAAVHRLRSTRLVRWFGLAGHAELPEAFGMDDAAPRGLGE
jgi:hypothetical protein